MSDTEIDFSKKKKKKKTLVPELDDIDGDERAKLDAAANEDLFGADDGTKVDTSKFESGDGDLDELNFSKKKKKKKKLDLGEDLDPTSEIIEDLDDLDLEKSKKKKKKPLKDIGIDETEEADVSEEPAVKSERPWLDRDLDKEGFLYEELLDRVFKIIHSKNPTGMGGTQKLYMPPPKLARIGTKKTCFTNFDATASALNRKQEHLMLFIFAELGTTGNQDAGGQLILKGKYQSKAMEKVLKQYCKDFVQCKTCKSYDTILDKRDRLFFVQCRICQSERTVQAITKGFVAITNKRSRIRNAAAAAVQK